MKRTLVIVCLSLAATACERSDRQDGPVTATSPTERSAEPEAPPSVPTAPSVAPGAPANSPGAVAPSSALEDRLNTSGRDERSATDTGRNERDRSGNTKTSGDQSESEADRTITQRIRQAVVADDSLSSQAKNAKIVTDDGVVTLRGPVESSKEKTQLGSLARAVDGVKSVDNQLEISGK